MIQLTRRLVMTADRHCYIIGEPWQKGDRPVEIKNPKYYSTAAQAVKGPLSTSMRQAVEDGEVTTLRQFIKRQEQLYAELEKLIAPLDGGEAAESGGEAHKTTKPGTDIPEAVPGKNAL